MITNPGRVSYDYHLKMKEINNDVKYDQSGVPMLSFQDNTNSSSNIMSSSSSINTISSVDLSQINSSSSSINTINSVDLSKASNNNNNQNLTIENLNRDNINKTNQINVEEVNKTNSVNQNLNKNQENQNLINENIKPINTVTDYDIHEARKKNPYYCSKCSIWRPIRTHHCRTCGTCFLEFDHHCPWIANCVGYYNHKLFFQFIFFGTIGDIASFLCFGYKLYHIDKDIVNYLRPVYPNGVPPEGLGLIQIIGVIKEPLMILIGCLLSLAMVAFIGVLMVLQFNQIRRGITSVEKASKKIDTNVKTSKQLANFKKVMGDTIYDWIEPFSSKPSYNYKYCKPYIVRSIENYSKKVIDYKTNDHNTEVVDDKKAL